MLLEEFEKLTGIYPDSVTYGVIEDAYMEFDGDKVAFCENYRTNKDGLAEKICCLVNEHHRHNEQEKKAVQTSYEAKINSLQKELESVQKSLDRELAWKFRGTLSDMSTDAYAELKNADFTEVLTIEQVEEIVCAEGGFTKHRIELVTAIPVYEVNKYGQLRQTGWEERKPLYASSDWSYIRFNAGRYQYEYINGMLHFFNS